MSSKLVKKLLLQATTPLVSSNEDVVDGNQSKRKKTINSTQKVFISKEDIVQEHIDSILRLDNLTQSYTSSTAKRSFDRKATSIKQQSKNRRNLIKNREKISNSRSSSSTFSQKPQEERYDKKRDKRRREEKSISNLAKAMKKMKKRKKKDAT